MSNKYDYLINKATDKITPTRIKNERNCLMKMYWLVHNL